tara:strand:- start:213 stop:521 length:309 start_codon:yes stop_codon:yes gene_type:complete
MKKGLKKPMNKQDKQDLELILYRLNEQDKSVQKLEKHFTSKFNEIHEDISFIKENLFNPNEGLWAETKQNTQFRENTTMWRTIIGGGLIALIGDMFWDMFTN